LQERAVKLKTITVSYPHYDDAKFTPQERSGAPRVYRVEKVTDSVKYAPGTQMSKETVDALCDDEDWKVIVVPAK
jgi:hypothetical protein